MKIRILTLFPEMFSALDCSILKRADDKGLIEIDAVDIRQFSTDKHKKCDDYPFGGGAGMVMTPQPIYDAVRAVDPNHTMRRIFMSPHGKTLSTAVARRLASDYDELLFLCGHYEGVDQRVIDLVIDEQISIGDYILTGGELAAMVTIDAVCRHVGEVIRADSLVDESFNSNLLEYPQYTRPQEFMGITVPDVLVSGNHAEIAKWRKQKSLEYTEKYRPDLIATSEEKQ